MSVINRVLKDLDQKGAAPSALAGVQAIQADPAPARTRWPWLLALLLPALGAAWWFLPAGESPPPAPEATREEAQPRLRMSETLSEPGAVVAPPAASPPLASAPEPTRIEPSRPAPAPAQPASEPPPVKLDTRLPEPRPVRVIKQVRPPSADEQADQAWRQATRLIELGRTAAAIDGLEATLRLDPGHGPARQTLIALSLEAGDGARGEALLREGLQLHPNDPWYHRGLGQLHLQRGDSGQAAGILKAGLGKGVDADYWSLYAGVLAKTGRHAEAAQAWREVTRLNPAHGPGWLGLAVSLEHAGQRGDAAAAYQRALQTRLAPELRDFAARKAGELNSP